MFCSAGKYLATGILTLQVQLPVLRPHLRQGDYNILFLHKQRSFCPPACRQPLTSNQGRCERCYISTWMCEQQPADLLSVADTLARKLFNPLEILYIALNFSVSSPHASHFVCPFLSLSLFSFFSFFCGVILFLYFLTIGVFTGKCLSKCLIFHS